MVNSEKLEQIMIELGHSERLSGTRMIRLGVAIYRPGIGITKELYPAIAEAAGSTPSRAERAMRHSIATAWSRGCLDTQQRIFGHSINPNTGVPTVGEYLARLHRVCDEN